MPQYRALRGFTYGGETREAGDLFELDEEQGNRLVRSRLAGLVAGDLSVMPTDNNPGMLRRETRTTAPIPNPPAGIEPVHPMMVPKDDLTDEDLDLLDGGAIAEEQRVRELVKNTDPNSEGVPSQERNAAAEALAAAKAERDAVRESRSKTPPVRPVAAEKAPADAEVEAETGAPPVQRSDTIRPSNTAVVDRQRQRDSGASRDADSGKDKDKGKD